jgi:hypothetical protein
MHHSQCRVVAPALLLQLLPHVWGKYLVERGRTAQQQGVVD